MGSEQQDAGEELRRETTRGRMLGEQDGAGVGSRRLQKAHGESGAGVGARHFEGTRGECLVIGAGQLVIVGAGVVVLVLGRLRREGLLCRNWMGMRVRAPMGVSEIVTV